jgi:hypothetical protein
MGFLDVIFLQKGVFNWKNLEKRKFLNQNLSSFKNFGQK